MAALALALTACAQTAPPPCPAPTSRWIQCANGVRISTYDADFPLERWCTPLADPDRELKRLRPGSPVYLLDGGYRTLWTGRSGWLILPREKDPTDTLDGIGRFFREFGCRPSEN